MVLLTEKLSYNNADEWMEKLLEISQNIPGDKQTEYNFTVENGVSEIARQNIAIQSQIMISCIEFFRGYPGSQYNQTYEPCHIYNHNKH